MALTSKFVVILLLWAVAFFNLGEALLGGGQTCHTDACLQVVSQDHEDHRYRGCTTFFRKTVYPADVTKAHTVHKIHTRFVTSTPVKISHSTSSTTLTNKITVTKKHTISTTQTFTKTKTITSTDVSTLSTTNVDTTFTTSTAIYLITSKIVDTAYFGYTVTVYNKRSVPTSTARTSSLTTVLPYAQSACKNTVRYSSACSCVGVEHRTMTMPAFTKKTSTTVTSTITKTHRLPVSETTEISTDTFTFDSTLFSTIPSTLGFFTSTTTSEPQIISRTSTDVIQTTTTISESTTLTKTFSTTSTRTIAKITTSVVSVPTFVLQVQKGDGTPVDGQYVQLTEYKLSYYVSGFTSAQTSATVFGLIGSARDQLSALDYHPIQIASIERPLYGNGDTTLYFNANRTLSEYPNYFARGTCATSNNLLSCTFGGYANIFEYCQGSSPSPLHIFSDVESGCTRIRLVVVPP